MNQEETKSYYSIDDVRASYNEDKADEERYGDWVAHYIYRPLSFQITPFFLRSGFSPSNVTFIALILVITLPFIAFWFPVAYLFVGLIAIIISVLDCVDGNIARVMGNSSKTGHYFDFLTDIICRVSLYLAIGIMIDQATDAPDLFAGVATEYLLIAALLAIVARMCRVYASSELIETDKDGVQSDGRRDDGPSNWLDKYAFPFFSGLDWALAFAIIILGSFGLLHWLLIWLLFYSMLDFLHTQYSIFSQLR